MARTPPVPSGPPTDVDLTAGRQSQPGPDPAWVSGVKAPAPFDAEGAGRYSPRTSAMADPMIPIGANPDDAVLRQIVESAAYDSESPDIRAVSSPRLELDRLRAAARELLRRADVASRAARAARHEEELRLP
jgi:hypothetical protein